MKYQRLDPFLSAFFQLFEAESFPDRFLEDLERNTFQVSVQNLKLVGVLSNIFSLLGEKEIEVISFKGPMLYKRLFY